MFGRLGVQRVLGLPGNPVSALVCARIFLVPLIEKLLGITEAEPKLMTGQAGAAFEANGQREHYMRARISRYDDDGQAVLEPVPSQDSSLMSLLATADAFVVRAPKAPAVRPGDKLGYLPIDF